MPDVHGTFRVEEFPTKLVPTWLRDAGGSCAGIRAAASEMKRGPLGAVAS